MKTIKKIILLCALACFVITCTESKKSISSGEIETEPVENLNIQTKDFTEIDSTGILIFPLKMGENKNRDGSYIYKEMPNETYWNILFYNTKTNKTHILTEKKVLILNYSYSQNQEIELPSKRNYIFYEIRFNDFNDDGLLNEKDPKYLFVSDNQGNNFRQISTNDYDVNTWSYVKSANKIIITATNDSNKNLQYDGKDEVSTFELTLDINEKPKEIFDNELKTKLKTLYDKDWKRVN